MKLIPVRKQVLDGMQLIQECCRDAVREQFVGGPDMIGETCRHRWGHRPPLTLRTEPSCGFGCWQRFLQPRVGKHQMVIGQGHPQLLLKPRQVLGKPIRTTGQAPIALALCEVVTLNKTGVHPLTHWRGRQACHHGLWLAKHHVRAHCHHPPFGAFLHDSRIQ
jgi:hypothetical protein